MALKRRHIAPPGNHPTLALACVVVLAHSLVLAQPASDGQSSGPAEAATTVTANTSTTTTQEPDAIKAAEKIVAQPGLPARVTESSDLGTTVAVVPTPSIVLKGDKLQVAGQDTTEALAVQTGAELLRKIGLVAPKQPKAPSNMESKETTPTQIFEDAQIRRMLNKDPSVVYQVMHNGQPIPDPMVVPWVRKAVVLKERFDQAVDLLAQKRITEARETLQEIIAEAPGTEYAAQAQGILQKLSDLTAPPTTSLVAQVTSAPKAKATPPPDPDFRPDSDVRVAATIVDPQDSAQNRVMINGRTYKSGEAVRNHTNHKVVRIRDDSVTIEVEQRGHRKLFDVPVRPQGF